MKYTVRWSLTQSPYQKPGEYEYSEFFVQEDPDPPGDWVVWYRWHHCGDHIDYWVRCRNSRRSAINARDLTCLVGQTELLSMYSTNEPRLTQVSRLALLLEKSRALIENRPERRYEGLCT